MDWDKNISEWIGKVNEYLQEIIDNKRSFEDNSPYIKHSLNMIKYCHEQKRIQMDIDRHR